MQTKQNTQNTETKQQKRITLSYQNKNTCFKSVNVNVKLHLKP